MTITPPDPITAARAELAAIESCWAIASRLPPTSRRRLSTWLISHEDAPVDHRERLPSALEQAPGLLGRFEVVNEDHPMSHHALRGWTEHGGQDVCFDANEWDVGTVVEVRRLPSGDAPPQAEEFVGSDMSPRAVVVFSPPLGSTVMDCRDEAIAFARGNSGLTYFEANEVRVRVHRLDDREQLDARWVEELTRVRGREAKGGDAPQEPSKPDADGRRWWADAGRGPAEHESMAAARLAAEDGLTECYESDWPPGTEDICWGELLVTHEATRDGDGYVLEATRPPGATDDPDDDRTCEEHVSRPPGGAEPDSMRTACLAAEACIDVLTTDTDLNVWWLNLGGQGGAYWHDKMAEAVAVALASEGAAPPSEPDTEPNPLAKHLEWALGHLDDHRQSYHHTTPAHEHARAEEALRAEPNGATTDPPATEPKPDILANIFAWADRVSSRPRNREPGPEPEPLDVAAPVETPSTEPPELDGLGRELGAALIGEPSQTPDTPGWWPAMVRVWPSGDGLIMAPIEGGAVDRRSDGGVFTWGAGEPVTAAALEVVAANLVQQWELDTGGSVEVATEQIMQDLRPLLGSTRGAQSPDDGLRKRVAGVMATCDRLAMQTSGDTRHGYATTSALLSTALRGES